MEWVFLFILSLLYIGITLKDSSYDVFFWDLFSFSLLILCVLLLLLIKFHKIKEKGYNVFVLEFFFFWTTNKRYDIIWINIFYFSFFAYLVYIFPQNRKIFDWLSIYEYIRLPIPDWMVSWLLVATPFLFTYYIVKKIKNYRKWGSEFSIFLRSIFLIEVIFIIITWFMLFKDYLWIIFRILM